MTSSEHSGPQAFLVPLGGPAIETIHLVPRDGGLVIGRHEQCAICLPADAEKVSRYHARLDHDGSRWHITDLKSRWGTTVNGVKLSPESALPLSEGDLIGITPWTFSLSSTAKKRGLAPEDDAGQTMVRAVAPGQSQRLAETMLALLLDCAGALHAATDEQLLCEKIIDAALRGTGLQNAAMLRPINSQGGVEVVASRFAARGDQGAGAIHFSRSLITAASQGAVAEIVPGDQRDVSKSIVQLQINSAICVPLMLGGAVAAYLYLDARGNRLQALPAGAGAFCVALGRIASLALANLKRIELEKRDAVMRAELSAAAAAQKWIMPQREGDFHPFKTIGESRAGQYVGGDFFDIVPLGEQRIALAVGDVSGKGISASVLMTAAQGFLHACLRQNADPAAAVTAVNQFIQARSAANKFVTMWVGVFDAASGTLRYVDAGHSYAFVRRSDGTIEQLNKGRGLPIGLEDSQNYCAESTPLHPGERVLVVSDGIIEQFGIIQTPQGTSREQFETAGLRNSLAQLSADPVDHLFQAVIRHAGTEQLSDDATAVFVLWDKVA